MSEQESTPLLPPPSSSSPPVKSRKWLYAAIALIITLVSTAIITTSIILFRKSPSSSYDEKYFFHEVKEMKSYCRGSGKGWVGYIGLKAEEEQGEVKRSFFVFHEADNEPDTAPLILTVGGGPGTSGHTRYWTGDGPCQIAAEGPIPNPHKWTEHFNYLALDHPIGVGFSYGAMVNNSADAAREVYDFLQKFYVLFPQLSKNQLVVNGGSYAGTYIPHIAHEIVTQNNLLKAGKSVKGTKRIPLESVMISNPYSDPLTHVGGATDMFCKYTDPPIFNTTQCLAAYENLPVLTQTIRLALEVPTLENRLAGEFALAEFEGGDLHGVMRENIRKKCDGSMEDCFPMYMWMQDFLNSVRDDFGVSHNITFEVVSETLMYNFIYNGDMMQRSTPFFPELLENGIRILHRVGMLDLNCPWTSVLNSLLLTPIPVQSEFTKTPNTPWPGHETEATIRVVGEGAGDFTYVQWFNAGHFVSYDDPGMERLLAEHWVFNKAF